MLGAVAQEEARRRQLQAEQEAAPRATGRDDDPLRGLEGL
jgi:hypothetical protein